MAILFSSTTAGLASKGHKVIGVDVGKSRVNGTNQGKPPIYVVNGDDMLKIPESAVKKQCSFLFKETDERG